MSAWIAANFERSPMSAAIAALKLANAPGAVGLAITDSTAVLTDPAVS
jgi:hypothetical protein